jgi:exopolysaccharide biosynthesis polyprenyl glycosylphosphotransferase
MKSVYQNAIGWFPFRKSAATRARVAPSSDAELISPDVASSWTSFRNQNDGTKRSRPTAPVLRGRWVQFVYAMIDICCVAVDGVAAFLLRFHSGGLRNLASGTAIGMDHRYWGFLVIDAGLILVFCQGQSLYRTPLTRPPSAESFSVVKAISFATLFLTAFINLSGVKILSRLVVAISALLNIITLAAWRYAKRRMIVRRVERGIGVRNALIVGAGKVGQALARQFEGNKLLGYRFVGFLDWNHSTDPRLLGKTDDFRRIARAEFVDEVFITIPSERELVKRVALEARQQRISVNVIPDLYDGLGWNAPLHRVGDFPVMDLHFEPIPTLGLLVKRIFDVVFSALGLVFCIPLLAGVAILIRWDTRGAVLYRSERVGKKGRVFHCYKLRTMVSNADELKESLRPKNERDGPFFKINDDPRITRIGKYLRKYSLDELPQLWNVLTGDMSLVGPRPHPLDDFKQYDLDHLRRLEVRPGITGLWQVTARRDPSFETNMRLDLEYIEHWNLRLDIEIILRTLPTLLRAEGC